MKNALSIDLEDWYYPELVRKHIKHPRPQIEISTRRILNLLDKYRTKATFFVLGDVAKKHPGLILKIYNAGHEIACHGMTHIPLWDINQAAFEKELRAFQTLINEIVGFDLKINGYRAPTFSLDESTHFALKSLAKYGYTYDSSIFPTKNYLYGLKNAPCHIYQPNLENIRQESTNSPIIEFPMTVYKIGKLRIPVSGGVYLRCLPYFLLRPMLKRINRSRPIVIYLHPWETYPKTPKRTELSFKEKIITYYGIESSIQKLENLLRDFKFGPLNDIITDADSYPKQTNRDASVKHYFETCAERFDSFYQPAKRGIIEQVGHVVFREPGMAKRFQTTCSILRHCQGKTILDAGCGSGIYSIYFAKQGAVVTGLDFSETMIALARRNAELENCRIDFRHQSLLDASDLPQYDYILLIGVFDYIKPSELHPYFKKTKALARLKIIATFPKRYTPQAPIRYLWLKRQGCPVYYYTKEQIEKIAAEFQLKPIFHDCKSIWTVEFRL